MKTLFSPRIQRVFFIAVAILFQLAAFVLVIKVFTDYFFYFYWGCVIISFLVSAWIANGKGKLPYKVAWIIPILLFPLLGGLLFIILGGARRPDTLIGHSTKSVLLDELDSNVRPVDLRKFGIDVVQQSQYLYNAAACPPYGGTETKYFPIGEDFYPVFLEELRKAERYIFLEYFIIAEGDMWDGILDILQEKAAEGLDIRVIYDDMGSVISVPGSFPRQLKKLGISCQVFRPIRPVLSIHQNNRDHRKICVIDGIVGFVGGINLADEYINEISRFGYWKDSALLMRGQASWSLSVLFLHMWECLSNETVDYGSFRPEIFPDMGQTSGFVQPYYDTPQADNTICADLHAQMIAKAKWYLYITTPYLIIDETIASALYISARSGVDVRIMTPHIPDKKTVFSVTQSHYGPLLEAGVRIYEFLPGFIHSKTLVADDLYASIGSCNMDYRSFYLQYENGVWLCGTPSVLHIREDFLASLNQCREITLEECINVPLPKRIIRSVLRIFSPLL